MTPRKAQVLRLAHARKSRIRTLYDAQNGICASCGVLFFPFDDDRVSLHDRATVDHVWPRARGGGDHMGNMVAMHGRCNSAKGDRKPTGCELIFHELVLSVLGLSRSDYTPPPDVRPTLAEVWPSQFQGAGL